MPKLTIGIPFRDEERRLADAIRCVFAQTFDDWELLLVDDGSRDDSRAIARSVQDARVRLIAHDESRGLPARLNEIVREAKGALVARMDADDVIHPTRLAKELARMDADPMLDAVGTFAAYRWGSEAPRVVALQRPSSGREVLVRGALIHATMVARRELLLAHPYDERLDRAEDRDFFCRVLGTARMDVVPEPLYVIRPEHDSPDYVTGYIASSRQNRVIYRRHGPRLAGYRSTAKALAGSYARELVYRIAARAGSIDRLMRRRGREATDVEARLIEEAILASQKTRVPGLSES